MEPGVNHSRLLPNPYTLLCTLLDDKYPLRLIYELIFRKMPIERLALLLHIPEVLLFDPQLEDKTVRGVSWLCSGLPEIKRVTPLR
jgi:hypothetical protein